MKTIFIITAALALAAIACAPNESPTLAERPTHEVAASLTATTRPAETGSPTEAATPTRPYSDVVWPTPTTPTWMESLLDNTGSPERAVTNPGPAVESTLLSQLKVANEISGTPYDRDDWGGWIDEDGDCQNTRAEVLQEESESAVTFRSQARCVVDTGQWYDEWSGQTFTEASQVDIDHHVPLANAHWSGGAEWSDRRKREFANDQMMAGSLNAMMSSLNRQKGAAGPDEWRPPNRASWCKYATDWATIKKRWQLTVTPSELKALSEMIRTCPR